MWAMPALGVGTVGMVGTAASGGRLTDTRAQAGQPELNKIT